MATVYDVYQGPDGGGPVDYTGGPVATTSGLTATLATLAPGTSARFAVRARDNVTGFDDGNTDASVLVTVAADGTDATAVPYAPGSARAVPAAGATASIEWTYAYPGATRRPTGFRVYLDGDARPSATVPWAGPGSYRATLTGLGDGTTYAVTVVGYNAAGEGAAATASLTADGTAPANVTGLTATASF